MLEDLGHTVVVGVSGEQALDRCARARPVDLVITDHAMPKMTGSDLAKQIAALHPDMPIILATGYAELPTSNFIPGMPRLNKPYRIDKLAATIAAVVGHRAVTPAT